MKKINSLIIILFIVVSTFTGSNIFADSEPQDKQVSPWENVPPELAQIKNLGGGITQVGNIIVDENKKEVRVPGHLNMLEGPVEFIACTKGGMKSYESVLEMETNAIAFNLSMILLGLDPKKGKASAYHFDPSPPQGDSVDISIQWNTDKGVKSIMAQELIHNITSGKTLQADRWIYTGSIFLENGRYLAEDAGVLIGFVHEPASIIESHFSGKFPSYGTYVVNKDLLLEVGTEIQMVIRPVEIDEEKKHEGGNNLPELTGQVEKQNEKANLGTD